LESLLAQLAPVDLVIVEGFKWAPHPKLEVYRAANGKPWLHPDLPRICGVIADLRPPSALPWVALDAIADAADLALRHAAAV